MATSEPRLFRSRLAYGARAGPIPLSTARRCASAPLALLARTVPSPATLHLLLPAACANPALGPLELERGPAQVPSVLLAGTARQARPRGQPPHVRSAHPVPTRYTLGQPPASAHLAQLESTVLLQHHRQSLPHAPRAPAAASAALLVSVRALAAVHASLVNTVQSVLLPRPVPPAMTARVACTQTQEQRTAPALLAALVTTVPRVS